MTRFFFYCTVEGYGGALVALNRTRKGEANVCVIYSRYKMAPLPPPPPIYLGKLLGKPAGLHESSSLQCFKLNYEYTK